MANRTTISIPDDLYKRMEAWKSEINFSREFQRCIGEKIDKLERYKNRIKGGEEMNEIVERLKSEMADSAKEMADYGKNEGVSWAKDAHYDEIQFVLKWNIELRPNEDYVEGINLSEYFEELFSEDAFLGYDENWNSEGWVDEATHEFLLAWKDGVRDFWDEVKEKL